MGGPETWCEFVGMWGLALVFNFEGLLNPLLFFLFFIHGMKCSGQFNFLVF